MHDDDFHEGNLNLLKNSNVDSTSKDINYIKRRPSDSRRQSLPANFKPLDLNSSPLEPKVNDANNIKVVCRFRPPNEKEEAMSIEDCMSIDQKSHSVKTVDGQEYFFDHIFDKDSRQKDVYEVTALPVVQKLFEGYNGTVLAYGQTASGKTYTMQGADIYDNDGAGIIPRMIDTVFEGIDSADENIEFTLQVSFMEIYMERIRDLLDTTKDDLKIREDAIKGIYVENLSSRYVTDDKQIFETLELGFSNRSTGETNMNQRSSRSHSIFVLTMEQRNMKTLGAKTGRLYLVDLAGSEKIRKTGAEGARLDEAKKINLSLHVLGRVINSLTDGSSSSIPYRESKLTRVLQESLGGNSRTALLIACSPSTYNTDETISTLRFGKRAKLISNKAHVNAELSLAELKLLLAKAQREIALLKKRLGEEGKSLDIEEVNVSTDDEGTLELRMQLNELLQEKNLVEENMQDFANQISILKLQNSNLKDSENDLYENLNMILEEKERISLLEELSSQSLNAAKMQIETLQAELSTEKELHVVDAETIARLSAEAIVLQSFISDFDKNTASLENIKTDLNSSSSSSPFIHQLNQLKIERNVSAMELTNLKEKFEQLNFSKTNQATDLECKIRELQVDNSALQERMLNVNNQLNLIKEESNLKSFTLDALKEENFLLKSEINKLTSHNSMLTMNLGDLKRQLEVIEKERLDLNSNYNEIKSKISYSDDLLENKKAEIVSMEEMFSNEKREMKAEIENISKKLTESTNLYSLLLTTNQTSTLTIRELNNNVISQSQEIEKYKILIEEERNGKEKVDILLVHSGKQLKERDDDIKEFASLKNNLQETIDSLSLKVDSNNNTILDIKKINLNLLEDMERKEKQYLSLIKDSQSKDTERGQAEKRLSDMVESQQQEVQKLNKELKSSQEIKDELENKFKYLKLENDNIITKILPQKDIEIENYLKNSSSLRLTLEQLESDINLHKKQSDENFVLIQSLKDNIEKLKKDKIISDEIHLKNASLLNEEISQYKFLLNQAQNEVEIKKSYISNGDSKMLEKSLEIHVLTLKNAENEEKLFDSNNQIKKKDEEMNRLNQNISLINKQLHLLESNNQETMNEIQRLRDEHRVEKSNLIARGESNVTSAVSEAIAQVQQQNKRTNQELQTTWEARIKASSERNDELEKEISLKQVEVETLQGIVNVQESKMRSLEERINIAERNNKKSETALQTALLEAKITNSSGEKNSHERRSMEFSALWDAHLSLIGQMESQAHNLVDAEDSLRNRIDRVAKLEMLLDEEKDKVANLKKTLERGPQKILEKRVSQLSELCRAREEQNMGLQIQIQTMEKKYKRLVDSIASEKLVRENVDNDYFTSTSIRGGGGVTVRRRKGLSPKNVIKESFATSRTSSSEIFSLIASENEDHLNSSPSPPPDHQEKINNSGFDSDVEIEDEKARRRSSGLL